MQFRINTILFTIFLLIASNLYSQNNNIVVLDNGLAVKTSDSFTRNIFAKDPIEYMIVTGKWKTPHEGDIVQLADSQETWKNIKADTNGWFKDKSLEGGYAYVEYESDKNEIALLEGMAYSMVYVNGVPRMGNKYQTSDKNQSWEPSYNYSVLPIKLKKGINTFLFRCTRGKLKARLILNKEGIFLNTKDPTFPDLLVGKKPNYFGAVIVINASAKPLKDGYIYAAGLLGISTKTKIPIIEPMSIRKIGFKIEGRAPVKKGNVEIKLSIRTGNSAANLAETKIKLRVLNPLENHKCTFISSIDGSVQYYSINPASDTSKSPKALFLSLHGAGVEAINQSGSYYPKTWGDIVCPTNRRPYGFDWEDWGRLDAMEVYNIALKTLNIDPSRIYLAGHSMGGHGTWQIGATYPDKFGALGPSAGWISFWTYYGIVPRIKNPTPMQNMVMRAYQPMRTYSLLDNYKQEGIYIIQGSKDDNVPPAQARNMVDSLKKFHHDFMYHEQPGVGHWWDISKEPGADCIDWYPLFDFFARHARATEKRLLHVEFVTACPGVSAQDYWLTIEQQKKQLEISKVNVHLDPGLNRIRGTTDNVEMLSFDTEVLNINKPVMINLDDQNLDSLVIAKTQKKIFLKNENGKWKVSSPPALNEKNPLRYGLFKDAFRHHMIFVYGTHGTPKENAWAFDKARFDAEQFWYQGNGSIDIVPDVNFKPSQMPDRSVIIYGNSKTNSAWSKLLGSSPVQVSEGSMKIGSKEFKGNDLGCLFIRPRKGSKIASVGVVSGSGIEGMKLTDRRPYLYSGYAFPDLMLFNKGFPLKGADGVLAAGFFGLDWSVKHGEFVFKN